MKYSLLMLLSAGMLLVAACSKDDEKPSDIPAIEFIALQPNSIRAGNASDTAALTFSFTDGDANLGNPNGDIFLIDNRTNDTIEPFVLPPIGDEVKDPELGISGTTTLRLNAAFPFLFPRDSLHSITGDTVQFSLYMQDAAGNTSNVITTTPLFILPS